MRLGSQEWCARVTGSDDVWLNASVGGAAHLLFDPTLPFSMLRKTLGCTFSITECR